jgi:hypothetical protein
MLELKDQCLHPSTKTPYIKMAVGGKQNSPEGLTVSFTGPLIVNLHVILIDFQFY